MPESCLAVAGVCSSWAAGGAASRRLRSTVFTVASIILATIRVGIARSKDGFTGFSLYASARIDPTKLARWPAMRNAWLPAGPGDEKALLLPAVSHPGRVGRDTRLVAIALPSVTGGLVRASPVAPRDAFMALVWQSRDVRRFPLEARDFRLLVALTRTIPCYRLEVGPDPVAVAEGLDRLIDGRSS